MQFIAEGIRMVYGDRRYWRYILVPWIWSTLIFAAVVVVGYFALVPFIQGQIDATIGQNSSGSSFLHGLVALAYAVIWFFIAGFVFLTITAITSSFLWEDLSRKVEESITNSPAPKSTLSNGRIALDSMSRGLFAILIAVLSLVCGWVIPIAGPVLLAGWVGLLDYTSPTFLRYDRTVGEQWPAVARMKGWFGFQIGAGLISLVPFLNVFLLPGLVAGGTCMAVRSRAVR
jgi:uncharacterized protein involved in cysteine biosynthesis